jgi:propanol-preferring alcohol dehydrogenase
MSPVIPGHQVVGVVTQSAAENAVYPVGTRVGIAWLHNTCGKCDYCRSNGENLCDNALFTGYTANGGFAEYVKVPQSFAYPIPEGLADVEAAPLLCAGIIGFRCLRLCGIQREGTLGLYGFGAAAHIAIQVAKHWGLDVFVSTRDERHQNLARDLGAIWAGGAFCRPSSQLDAAIIFAPAGELVPAALGALKKGGTLVLGGIHMSAIPSMPYQLLYHERVIRSVANNTREDGREFLELAAEIPLRPQVQVFHLREANKALLSLKVDAIRGAGVLQV